VGGNRWALVGEAVRSVGMAMVRAILLSTTMVAPVSLSRAQTIDLVGYQLNSATFGLVPVFDHDVRGVIRCGDAKSANAKVDLVKLRGSTSAGASRLPSLHTNSDERGSFGLWVPEGDWMLIVRATCRNSVSPWSRTLLRIGHAIHVSPEVSKHSIRALNVKMETGEMQVVSNGEPETEIRMDGEKGKDPIF